MSGNRVADELPTVKKMRLQIKGAVGHHGGNLQRQFPQIVLSMIGRQGEDWPMTANAFCAASERDRLRAFNVHLQKADRRPVKRLVEREAIYLKVACANR